MAALAKKDPVLALDPAENSWGPSGPTRDELLKRIWFTLGALLVFRLGNFIPLPGLGSTFMSCVIPLPWPGQERGIFCCFPRFPLSWASLFCLGLAPYFAALIVTRLAAVFTSQKTSSTLAQIGQGTRLLATALAVAMAIGVEWSWFSVDGSSPVFRAARIATLAGGAIFLMWLGEQITRRGIGHGPALIVATGIVAGLPNIADFILERYRIGSTTLSVLIILLVMVVAIIGIVVAFERARRRILTHIRRHRSGLDAQGLQLRPNGAGILPPFLAMLVLFFSNDVLSRFVYNESGRSELLYDVASTLDPGQGLGLLLRAALILLFALLFRNAMHDPHEEAGKLAEAGGFIPGLRPGEATARYLEQVQNRLAAIGAGYLVVVCLGPTLLNPDGGWPLFPLTAGLVIVAIVICDLLDRLRRSEP